jgi:hypothetical protein
MANLKLLSKDEAYKPNFQDPRALKRLQTVLTWANQTLSERLPTQVHNSVLNEVFGPSGNKLSKYLRANLLIQSGTYKPGVSSFKYTLNAERAAAHSSMVNTSSEPVDELTRLKNKYAGELANFEFKYSRKADRDWHGLQNVPTTRKNGYTGPLKHEFWHAAGLRFDNDFQACAPTILSQLATMAGLPNILQDPIFKYLDDRQGFRSHVQAITGLGPREAKQLINSLFNGAKLSRSPYCAAYRMLGHDYLTMTNLMNDPQVAALRAGIGNVWRKLGLALRTDFKTGSAKWKLYFVCERRVMNVVTEYLTKRRIKFFTEHDGFRTSERVDASELEAEIEAKTKFKMTIEQEER